MIKMKTSEILAALFLLLGIISCAAIPRLYVTYTLPPKTGQMTRPVIVVVQDERSNAEIMGIGARREFGGPPEGVSLAVKSNGEEHGVGIFELTSLLKEGFKERLEAAGFDVTAADSRGAAEISILLRDFFLDFSGRKWTFIMAYEARLLKEGKVVSSQTIRGNAERMKILGRKQADQLVSEVFTDTLNQFDPDRLFRQAGL